jgi:hypothetical protein
MWKHCETHLYIIWLKHPLKYVASLTDTQVLETTSAKELLTKMTKVCMPVYDSSIITISHTVAHRTFRVESPEQWNFPFHNDQTFTCLSCQWFFYQHVLRHIGESILHHIRQWVNTGSCSGIRTITRRHAWITTPAREEKSLLISDCHQGHC